MTSSPTPGSCLGADRDLIRRGYDQIAGDYSAARDQASSLPYLERLDALLRPNSHVLDLGCGAGLPVDRWLVGRGHRVTGVDFSAAMLELARRNVPQARYEQRDMAELPAGLYQVDAVVSFLAIIHLDRRLHARLLHNLRSYLPMGGLLLVTMGRDDWDGHEIFHGVPMCWSHYDRTASRGLVTEAGFSLFLEDLHRGNSQGDDDWHPVFLARAV